MINIKGNEHMSQLLMGKKRGMSSLFDKDGNLVVCTVIEVEPNVVTQIKTKETDGYTAIQTGFDKVKGEKPETIEKRTGKPLFGHYKKANVDPRRNLVESRMDNVGDYNVGQEITVELFKETAYIDVTAKSIGKGYQGSMKLHNFGGLPATHGVKKVHRSLGSTGNRSTPGRCFPGGERDSHMGAERVTVQNLKVVEIIAEDNIIIVEGAVPGPKNGVVTMQKAKKLSGAK